MSERHDPNQFDEAFYERFYKQPDTRASSPEEFARLSRFVLSYLEYLEIPLNEVLDLGCGLGRWRETLRAHDSKIRYTGVEVSPYLCRQYGWTESSVSDFSSRHKYDLVICQDVLPYLTRRGIRDALANIARHCRGAVYLQVLTEEDWDKNHCDPARTDETMNRFETEWYRKAISRHFINCGGGLFVPKDSEVVIWELERSE
jgi:2-polyprenyl-3-methyl-5-hydroxy-6-metoxy-1,4-benzoquinol methylase